MGLEASWWAPWEPPASGEKSVFQQTATVTQVEMEDADMPTNTVLKPDTEP